ncbi:Na-translocating system protein MpsC family protein [Clostridium sp. ZS2-4]|uniref:Na-translocating system protein MpsC family protein n=1 Tax=Clostridium sp. ZS2-4 TaxID=2987703 RepID=UPI00227C2E84|nr:Na-translocating system protein MpsC family protein [Clostridium sp. ZS2-4]MCY6354161.1 Na-translocating system protein MpsC family protein [Clostridium sp. ZS2-4]
MDVNNTMKNLKVLFVEDEEITKVMIKKMLKEKFGEVFVAKNGEQGLELFQIYRPQIVITDLKMPVLDGITMIKKIREIDKECGIIINTEVGDVNYILESIDIGIDKYLIKPISKEELFRGIEIVIEKISSRKGIENQLKIKLEFSKEEKVQIENKIKAKISGFFKTNIGKGPQDTKIFIKENVIIIKIYDILTNMEKSLLQVEKNHTLVEYNRRIFYKSKYKELENIVETILNRKVKLSKIKANILNNIDEITYKIY